MQARNLANLGTQNFTTTVTEDLRHVLLRSGWSSLWRVLVPKESQGCKSCLFFAPCAGCSPTPPQVASRTWEELNAEAQRSAPAAEQAADDDGDASAAVPDLGDGLEWLELWGVERSSLPEWFTAWKAKDNAVRNKIRGVVRQEWAFMQDREASVGSVEGRGGGEGSAKEGAKSGLPPPGPPLLDESGRFFDLGAYVSESTVFPFVLIESFWRYSDPKSGVSGVGVGVGEEGVAV